MEQTKHEDNDLIDSPNHYRQHPSGVEPIQVAEYGGFIMGNAIKYLFRWPYKGQAVDDLKKARNYLERMNYTRVLSVFLGNIKHHGDAEKIINQVLDKEPVDTPLHYAATALLYTQDIRKMHKVDHEIWLAIHAINDQLKELEN